MRFVRYCPAQSRHDSGVGACLVESGLYHSILVHLLGLVYIFSPYLASFLSRFHFSMLLLSFFRSLVRVASRGSPFFFSGTCRRVQHVASTPWWSRGALPISLAALGLVARRSSASPGSAPMRV